ncbi:16S rRNA (guanine(966)-N(2))-methyltransferase RsmD [Bacillaceae bacterium]
MIRTVKQTTVIDVRVIAGAKKGRRLYAVPGRGTRPTTDRVKEAIFSMIGPFFSGGTGLDLYAGTGSLGIEALSRGLDRVIFVDENRQAVDTIKRNLAALDFTGKAEVYRNDARRALKALGRRGMRFELVFLDPPYAERRLEGDITMLEEQGLLAPGGLIVAEHDERDVLPEAIGRLQKVKANQYGITSISIFKAL